MSYGSEVWPQLAPEYIPKQEYIIENLVTFKNADTEDTYSLLSRRKWF